MLCIQSAELNKIETALKAYDAAIVNVRPIGCMQQALKACEEVRNIVASDEEREAASNLHANDELEIDDEASVSHADDGYWVSAWVWVPKDEEEDEPDTQSHCGTCGRLVGDHNVGEYDDECTLPPFTDEQKADMKHNAQMLDGCETADEINAELRAQTQGDA